LTNKLQTDESAQQPLRDAPHPHTCGQRTIALVFQLHRLQGVMTMATRFGKDPNMKKSNHAELERLNLERKQKLAEAAIKFNQKKTGPASKEVDGK
jgi:hypothetical protein